MLCRNSDQNEVLWNFTRFKGENRLRLKQNPQFYKSLPKSPGQYGDEFEAWPIERFLHKETNGQGYMDIDVLTDTDTGRVYLETAPKKRRAFGNVWSPHNAIIFKGSRLFNLNVFFRHFIYPQISTEGSRVKGSSASDSAKPFRPFKAGPTYGVSKSFRQMGAVPHQPQPYKIGANRFAKC